MQVRLLKSMKDDKGWHKPGAVLEVTSEEAKFLLQKKAAVAFEEIKTEVNEPENDEVDNQNVDSVEILMSVLEVSEVIAEAMIEAGFDSIKKVAEAKQPHLVKVKGISGKSAVKLIEAAQLILEEQGE